MTRFSGKNRFETADMVPNWSVERKLKPRGDFYILDGWDEGLILYTLQNQPNSLILIVSPHQDLVNAIRERAEIFSKMASSGGAGYGRSVYVDPTLFGGGTPPCNCTPMRIDELKALALSIDHLREMAANIGDESIRSEVLLRVEGAQKLSASNPEKARELVREGSCHSRQAGPAGTAARSARSHRSAAPSTSFWTSGP